MMRYYLGARYQCYEGYPACRNSTATIPEVPAFRELSLLWSNISMQVLQNSVTTNRNTPVYQHVFFCPFRQQESIHHRFDQSIDFLSRFATLVAWNVNRP